MLSGNEWWAFPPTARTNDAPHAGLYTPQQSESVYLQLLSTSEQVLTAGYSVIVDATFLKQNSEPNFRRLADKLKIPFYIPLVRSFSDVIRERISPEIASGNRCIGCHSGDCPPQLQSLEPPAPRRTGVRSEALFTFFPS